MTKVALVSGFWGQNIGNAFFNLGGKATLDAAGLDSFFVQDMPAYATFRNEKRGSFKNAYPMLLDLEFDLLILQGPLFTENFANIWLEQLQMLQQQGKGWAALGAAFRKYTQSEVGVVRDVVESVPPLFISTRDNESYDLLGSVRARRRAGVDSAFFLPEAFKAPKLTNPTVAVCFDHYSEPLIVEDERGEISLGDLQYSLHFDERANRMADRSKAHAIAYQLLDRKKNRPTEIGGYRIVRPDHRTNPHIPAKIYRDANGVASDEPWTYASVYANSVLTISDRVHACVATLAYGGEALLHNPGTKRSALFSAVGAGDIQTAPARLDPAKRRESFAQATEFLTSTAGA